MVPETWVRPRFDLGPDLFDSLMIIETRVALRRGSFHARIRRT